MRIAVVNKTRTSAQWIGHDPCAPGPDLIPLAVTGPSTARRGTVDHRHPKCRSFALEFYLSTDTTITASDTFTRLTSIPTLGAGTTNSASLSMLIPAGLSPGVYYYGLIVDSSSLIEEANDANNLLTGGTINITQ